MINVERMRQIVTSPGSWRGSGGMMTTSGGTASSGALTPGPRRACQLVGNPRTPPHRFPPMAVIYLMNTTVIPQGAYGAWEIAPVSLPEVQALVQQEVFISAVGHQSTAEVISSLLGQDIQPNRIQVRPDRGDRFLCFRLLARAPEGAVLDREQIEEIGHEWCVMHYLG